MESSIHGFLANVRTMIMVFVEVGLSTPCVSVAVETNELVLSGSRSDYSTVVSIETRVVSCQWKLD